MTKICTSSYGRVNGDRNEMRCSGVAPQSSTPGRTSLFPRLNMFASCHGFNFKLYLVSSSTKHRRTSSFGSTTSSSYIISLRHIMQGYDFFEFKKQILCSRTKSNKERPLSSFSTQHSYTPCSISPQRPPRSSLLPTSTGRKYRCLCLKTHFSLLWQ